MPIRGLQEFLDKWHLINTDSTTHIANTRIGVDAAPWYRKTGRAEPFHVAMGGLPLTALTNVQAELNKFSAMGVKPMFVFQGLNLPRKDRPFMEPDTKAQNRVRAWEAYANGEVNLAVNIWQNGGIFLSTDLVNAMFKLFKEQNVDYIRAPYLSWAQLSWMASLPEPLVHGVYAGLELLLFNVPRLIVDIKENGTFDWIETASMLKALDLTADQFMDCCLLAGFDYLSTFPPIRNDYPETFQAAVDMVRQFKSGFAVIQNFGSQSQVVKSNYMEQFLKARTLIRHHLVFEPSCMCEPLHRVISPHDLDEVIGPRLPNEVYFFLSQGIVTTQVVNNLLSGMLIEVPPLVDSEEYRRMIYDLGDLRAAALCLLSSALHESYRHRKVVIVRWFDPQNEYPLPYGAHPLSAFPVRSLSDAEIRAEIARQAAQLGYPVPVGTPRAGGPGSANASPLPHPGHPPVNSPHHVPGQGGSVTILRHFPPALPLRQAEPTIPDMLGLGFIIRWQAHCIATGASMLSGPLHPNGVPKRPGQPMQVQIPGGPPTSGPRRNSASAASPSGSVMSPNGDVMPPPPPQDGIVHNAEDGVVYPDAPHAAVTIESLHSLILLQALHICRYVSPPQSPQRVSVFGRALELAFVHQEESMIVLELIRSGHLSASRLSVPFPLANGAPLPQHSANGVWPVQMHHLGMQPPPMGMNGAQHMDVYAPQPVYLPQPLISSMHGTKHPHYRDIILISRVCGLLPMCFKEGMFWQSRVDHDLMGFNSIVKALYRSLRNLVEMLMLSAFLRHEARLPPRLYMALSLRLPFFQEPNTAMGNVLKTFLEGGPMETQNLPSTFPVCIDPLADLINAFAFWDQVLAMVSVLREEYAITDDLWMSFDSANRFLQMKRRDNRL